MVVGEGKRRRITVLLGCGRGREGGFGDERLWENNLWRWVLGVSIRAFGSRGCDLSFGLGYGSWRLSHGSFLESVGIF